MGRATDPRYMHLCFIDIETTGHIIGYHEIIELGAIRTTPDAEEVLGEYTVRVMPLHPDRATPTAIELNGFSPEAWKSAVPLSEGMARLGGLTRSAVPVCHNPSFDRSFIEMAAHTYKVALDLHYHWIGTESLAWPAYKQGRFSSLRLSDLCTHLGLQGEPIPHSALEGARTCLQVYRALIHLRSTSD